MQPYAFLKNKNLCLTYILLIVGIAYLAIYSALVGLSKVYIAGFNDQVVYIDVARHLIQERQLTTGVIYPSVLLQNYSHHYFYMPGHALVTALSFWFFGDNTLAAFLPNIISYLVCIILLYRIGLRLVNRTVGFIAGFLFAVFPLNIIFSVSAMSEMTFLSASVTAFAIFLYLPTSFRLWLGPILACLPFLFRETGALWIIPMGAVILSESSTSRHYFKALAFVGISLILFIMISQLDWIKGRPSRLYLNLLARNFDEWYLDAFAVSSRIPQSLADWFSLLSIRGLQRLRELWWELNKLSKDSIYLHWFIWPPIFALAALRLLPRFRILIITYGLMACIIFAFLTVFYYWTGFVGIRLLLILLPVQAIVVAGVVDQLCRTTLQRNLILGTLALLALPVLIMQANSMRKSFASIEALSPILDTVNPDRRGTLISSVELGTIYVYKNFPAQWAFVPANEKTLYLLHEKYFVTSAILTKKEVERLGEGLSKIGLAYSMEIVGANGETYLVFKRPPPTSDG